jgi:hypothetical protein
MEKSAETAYPIHDLLRRSRRRGDGEAGAVAPLSTHTLVDQEEAACLGIT